jgi:hypothetical protein
MESQVVYEGFAAIDKALQDPKYALHRRSTMLESGRRIGLEEAFRLAQKGREELVYAAPVQA